MDPISLLEFADRVERNYLGRGRSRKTTRQFRQVLKELMNVGCRTTADITDLAITDWIDSTPGRTPETLRSHLRALASLTKRATKQKLLLVDPFAIDPVSSWIRTDGRPRAPKRRWSKPADEIRHMLHESLRGRDGSNNWGDWRLWAYAHTLFMTGGRPGEIQRLRLCDYCRRDRSLEIVAHWCTGRAGRRYWWKPKTEGSAGILPIGPFLCGVLDEWIRYLRLASRRGRLRVHNCEFLFPGRLLLGPWTDGSKGDSPLDAIRGLGERAGISGLTQKAARKGLGTYRDIGLSPLGRREYFRHSDDATGDLYDESDLESRRGDAILIERFFTGT